jgi:hypothetical protein
LQQCEGSSYETAAASWKLFVFPDLKFPREFDYKCLDAVERTIITICGAQTAGCLNLEAGGKFAEFALDDQTQCLLKQLPQWRSLADDCLSGACPSTLSRVEGLVHSIRKFADTHPAETKYNRITEALANTMAVQGSRRAEYLGWAICGILCDEPSKMGFNSGETFITGVSPCGRTLQMIFANVLQASTPVTLAFWNVLSWPKVDPMECLQFCRRYMEIMEPLCVAGLGNTAEVACRGSFEHLRPTPNTDCYHLCRSDADDPESIFIMVPIVHPG